MPKSCWASWALRLVPVLGLIVCVLPLMALVGLLGGIDPNAVVGSFLVAIGCAVVGCSLSLALSVWGRKTRDVLMLTYLIIVMWLFCRYLSSVVWGAAGSSSIAFFAPQLPEWFDFVNPFYLAWAPYLKPGSTTPLTALGFLTLCLSTSVILVGLATWRIRAVVRARGQRRAVRLRIPFRFPKPAWGKWLPGPSLDGNPILWREWYRAKPSPLMRVVWCLYSAMGITWVVLAARSVATGIVSHEMIATMNVFQVGLGLLLLSVNAATSLLEERVRGSLDIVLSTPLSTRTILVGKWVGTYRAVPQLLFAPVLTTLCVAWESGRWIAYFNFVGLLLAYSAVIVSLGLALATWLSRLERALALCIGAYVVFSIGWPVMVLSLAAGSRADDHFTVPLVMGSSLLGTLFGTMSIATDTSGMPGGLADVWLGCYLWMAIYGAAATMLFAAAATTFDRCLGRMPESDLDLDLRYWRNLEASSGPRPRATDWETPPRVAPRRLEFERRGAHFATSRSVIDGVVPAVLR